MAFNQTTYNGNSLNTAVGNFDLNPEVVASWQNLSKATNLQGSAAAGGDWAQHAQANALKEYYDMQTKAQKAAIAGDTKMADYWQNIMSQHTQNTGINPENSTLLNNIADSDSVGLGMNIYGSQGGDTKALGDALTQKYIQENKSKALSGFLKVAAPLAIAAGGYAFAPALFGGAGATGVAAGNATGTFGNFATNAALKGALTGGISGYASGGDLGSALKGAALGGLTGGYGDALGAASGLGATGTAALKGGLTGASGALANGDLRGAALGGALGAGMGYYQSGGNVPGFGNAGETINWDQGGTSTLRKGTGILGGLSNLKNNVSGSLSGLTGGNTSMLGDALKIGGAFYEDSETRKNNEAIQRQLMEAQGRAQGQLSPYVQAGADATGRLSAALSAGFQPGDLTQDPGYQFRLQQGEEALARRMAASGLGQSGAALKAAQEYGQGLADQTYNDAFQRYQATNNQNQVLSSQGLGAADASAGLDMYGGQNIAELMAKNQESKNKRLSSILSGIGAFF